VRFELVPPTGFASHCHCEDCRRSHAAAFVTWTSVPTDQFRLLSGKDELRRYESHAGVFWGFCGKCGTSMFYDADDTPERIYVTVTSLVDPLDRDPDSHVSFEERAPWYSASKTLPCFRGKTDERMEDKPHAR
jgi:hypothetical protein